MNKYNAERSTLLTAARLAAVLALCAGAFLTYRGLTSGRSAPVDGVSSVPSTSVRLAATTTTTTSLTIAQAPTTSATTTTAPASTTTLPLATTAPPSTVTYKTLPDGTPEPVVAVFDVATITLAGAVPSQAAVDRLQALAAANSKTPATITNMLTIDPRVPIGVGVRVVELTSARFASGSAVVVGAHAKELDRVVAVMAALPNVTALVVGHADQVGSALGNFALSEDRARAVVAYFISQGVAPGRVASRGVGQSDLLSLNDDATSLALNRRTEFILYGLLVTGA